MRPTRILSSDILIADVIMPLAGNDRLTALIEKYNTGLPEHTRLVPGGKVALTEAQFREFSAALEGRPVTLVPGGSSANTLTTLGKLLGDAVDIRFIGVIGGGLSSSMIKGSLSEAGITLLPETLPPDMTPKTAVSYVILFPDGQRAIATYPGNAREILKPDLITDEMVKNSDVLLVQGSLWQKLDWEFTDKLLDLRRRYGNELWLAMPTHARFGRDKGEHFQQALTGASVVLGNEDELARIYHTTPEQALERLKAALERTGKGVGFITRADKGAFIVTAGGIDEVASASIRKTAIVNTLGAGDTSFAGFAAGYLRKLPHTVSAQIAMTLAGEKLKVNGPRLPDPAAALRGARPDLAALLPSQT